MLAELDAYARRLDALVMAAERVCLLTGNVATACGRLIGFPAPEPTASSDFAPWRVFRRIPEVQRCQGCGRSLYAAYQAARDPAPR